jgi:hypothetical protein
MQQFTSGHALPENDLTGVIHADDVKHQLCDVDAEHSYFLCHGSRLFWVNGCPRCRKHSGSLKPHWKEAGPFH